MKTIRTELENNGFTITGTGGNCTAHIKIWEFGGIQSEILATNDMCAIAESDTTAELSLWVDGDYIGGLKTTETDLFRDMAQLLMRSKG